MIGQRKNGEKFPIELVLSAMTLGGEQVTVAFARDVSQRKQAQRYLTAHYAATCILAEANSLDEALPLILQSISEALRWDVCAFWCRDPATNELTCAQFFQAPFAALPNESDTKSLAKKLDRGLPGQVFSTAKPIWIEDLLRRENTSAPPQGHSFPCAPLSRAR